jgi:hypothetical protein
VPFLWTSCKTAGQAIWIAQISDLPIDPIVPSKPLVLPRHYCARSHPFANLDWSRCGVFCYKFIMIFYGLQLRSVIRHWAMVQWNHSAKEQQLSRVIGRLAHCRLWGNAVHVIRLLCWSAWTTNRWKMASLMSNMSLQTVQTGMWFNMQLLLMSALDFYLFCFFDLLAHL